MESSKDTGGGNRLLCPKMIANGQHCIRCSLRHRLQESDLPVGNDFTNKFVKIEIGHYNSPAHFLAKILGYRQGLTYKWEEIDNSDFELFEKDFVEHYLRLKAENNLPKFTAGVRLNYFGVIFSEEKPHRVQIIKTYLNEIHVQMIDYAKVCVYDPAHVFYLERRFQQFPPQSVNVYIAGINSYDIERKRDVKGWLTVTPNVEAFVQADNVLFHLKNIFVVEDVKLIKHMPDSQYRSFVSVKSTLIKNKYANENPEGTAFLKDLYAKLGKLLLICVSRGQ